MGLSESLQELLQSLAAEGRRDSGGSFTLAAEKVSQRYRTLLELHPELPWLRFLQYCYRVRARRFRCVMGLLECQLSLAGSLEVAEIVDSLRRYPEAPDGDASLLHQVTWLFLAQQPRSQVLRVRLPGGHLRLEVGDSDFALSESEERLEDDLTLSVTWGSGWLGVFYEANRRAAVQRAMARRVGLFPGVVEWDGGLPAQSLPLPGRRRLVIATLVNRNQAERIPHFAWPRMRGTQVSLNGERLRDYMEDEGSCDWLALQQKEAGHYELSGDRWRLRLLFVYAVDRQPAQLLPVVDGCLLEPCALAGWPAGITVLAACPPDVRCDYSGMKLVDDEALRGFLAHLRRRYADSVFELVRDFDCEFATLGDLLAAD